MRLPINFSEIQSLKNLLNVVQVEQLDYNIKSKPLRKSTLYCCNHANGMVHCLLVVGDNHSAYDMRFFVQEIKCYLDRQCCNFVLIDSDLGNNSWTIFESSERDSIIVDSNETLIKLETIFNGGTDVEEHAKSLSVVSHYTTSKSAVSILMNHTFQAKSLSRYNTEQCFSFNENSRRLAFISCFTKKTENDPELWENEHFGNKHRGCKIDFYFKRSLFEAFNHTAQFGCCDKDGNQYLLFATLGEQSSSFPTVCFHAHYKDIDYERQYGNNVNLQIYDNGLEDFTIIDILAKSVIDDFDYQNEVRIVLILQAVNRTEIPFIQSVDVPYNPDEIEKIAVTIGNNMSSENWKKLFRLKQIRQEIELFNEDGYLIDN